jgi:heme oxygenase (biliverdin-producing, ferredoxin)
LQRSLVWLPVAPLARAAALRTDLEALAGAHWPQRIAPAAAAVEYAARVQTLAAQNPALLAAHVYVRYLGDLHGGQLLAKIVARTLALHDGSGLSFYQLGDAVAVRAHVLALREGLDRCASSAAEAGRIVDEARDAFQRHIRLFEQLHPHAGMGRPSALVGEAADLAVQRGGAPG